VEVSCSEEYVVVREVKTEGCVAAGSKLCVLN
jgi:hypothetical protein